MRKVILILAMMLYAIMANSQLKINKIDSFTGEHEIRTERVRVVDGRWYTLVISIERMNGVSYFRCNFWANRRFDIIKGETILYFKCQNGYVGKSVCVNDEKDRESGVGLRERHAEFLCEVPLELIRNLSESQPAEFRLELSVGDAIEYPVTKKRGSNIQKQALAFMEAINDK